MFRSFPLGSGGVGYCQSKMILSGNLALKNFCPLSFIDRELPLFFFHFFSILDREKTSNLPLGSLEVFAWYLSLPQCKALRYQLLSFVMTL